MKKSKLTLFISLIVLLNSLSPLSFGALGSSGGSSSGGSSAVSSGSGPGTSSIGGTPSSTNTGVPRSNQTTGATTPPGSTTIDQDRRFQNTPQPAGAPNSTVTGGESGGPTSASPGSVQ